MSLRKLFAAILISLIPVVGAFSQKVKVGYYYSENFQEGLSDEQRKIGYGYEYLQRISNETGWSYEYIYGTWSELLEKLKRGEIDLLSGVNPRDCSDKSFLLSSNAMGTENHYLYGILKDPLAPTPTISNLNGKKIGVIRNSRKQKVLEEWSKDQNLSINIVCFENNNQRDRALSEGTIDYFLSTDNIIEESPEVSAIFNLPEHSYYIGINAARPDLLSELNQATDSILHKEPYFIEKLQNQYFGFSSSSLILTTDEILWLHNHKKVRIGYVKEYLPFCDEINGETVGLITDIMNQINDAIKLKNYADIEYYSNGNYWQLLEMLQNGELDAIYPAYKSLWHSEMNSSRESEQVCPAVVDLIYSGEFTEDTSKTIAVSNHSPIQRVYVDLYFPDSQIVVCKNANECLQAVLHGKAKSTLFSSYRADYFLSTPRYKSLHSVLQTKDSGYCFLVNDSNRQLLSILNKGISTLDQDKLTLLTYNYINKKSAYSFGDFFRMHMWAFIIFFILVSVVVFVAIAYHFNTITFTNHRLHEQLEIVQTLSREYLNIFVLYLDRMEFKIVKLDGFKPEGLENGKNRYYSYQYFIEHYAATRVFSEDMDDFLAAVEIDNVIEQLSTHVEFQHSYRIYENNTIHNYQFRLINIGDPGCSNKIIVGFSNIDEIVKAAQEKEQLKIQAENDGLTGIHNRGFGERTCVHMLKGGINGLLCVLDVDHFKKINDTYGHSVGDKVLVNVATSLKTSFREQDIVFRLGGDEFVVLAKDIYSEQHANHFLSRFKDFLNFLDVPEMKSEKISVSIGACLFTDTQKNFDTIYEHADSCVYESKKQDGTFVTFYKN